MYICIYVYVHNTYIDTVEPLLSGPLLNDQLKIDRLF